MAFKVLACMTFLVISSAKEQSRWSRQISSYTADISDWVPLSGPIESEPPIQLKRQAVAEPRILSEPFPEISRQLGGFNGDQFPSRTYYNSPPNRQLYLQSIPSAPQNYLTEQGFGQGLRLGLSQPNFPLTQGFIAPQYNFDNLPDYKPKPQTNTNPIKFDNFPQTIPQFPTPSKAYLNQPIQPPKQRAEVPKYVDGYRVDNSTDLNKRKPQSLQKIRFDNHDTSKEVINTPKTKIEREEVQLLYVPLESLNRGQFNFRNPIASPQILNRDLYNQSPKQNPLMQNLAAEIQRPTTKPVDTYKSQDLSSRFNSQLREIDTTMYSTLTLPFTTTAATTPKPKLKPHQPPLAIFLAQEVKKGTDIKVSDVLSSLKNAKTVPVLDSVNPVNAPEVFIGPSSLSPPERFVKFELPYLSNIENKDKKLKQLPFFVAPLSYNTPQGFAKIPFPSPHVGSVVINSQIQESSSTTKAPTVANVFPNSYTEPFVYNERQPVTQKPKISYYSTTAPKENMLNKYKQNYYSFEPQTVSTISPKQQESNSAPPKTGSYFINNGNQFNPSQYVNFPQENVYQNPVPSKLYKNYVQDTTSTTKSSTTITTKPPSTYSTRLLETHNPYSINQGLQFNAPNEYQNFFDEFKEPHVTQGYNPSQTPQTPASVPNIEDVKYEQTQSPNRVTPSYQQNYQAETYYNKQSNQDLNYQVPSINDLPTKTVSQTQSPNAVTPSYQPNYQAETYYNKQNNQDLNYQVPSMNDLPAKTVSQTQSPNWVTPTYHRNDQGDSFYNKQSSQDLNYQVPNVNELPARTALNSNNDKIQPSSSINANYDSGYETVASKSQFDDNSVTSTQSSSFESYSEIPNNLPKAQSNGIQSSNSNEFNGYDVNYSSEEIQPSTTTSTSTTTTTTTTSTRRTPVRSRGRPKYPTVKPDTNEYSTRPTITRRPLRERRPSTNRPRYEPNKTVSEKTTKQSLDSSESTTRSYKYRTRGKVHYKPSEGEEIYEKQIKESGKMADLAYQRDILHQNYPVTLMERASTVDIEAITEPIEKSSSLENVESTKSDDTANAYSNDELSITKHSQSTENEQLTSVEESHTRDVPLSNNKYEENDYEIRSTAIPQRISFSTDESNEDAYSSQTIPKLTQSTQGIFEIKQNEPISEYKYSKENEEQETEKNYHASSQEEGQRENIVETTPSYNRVRIRPGVIRQHHQASTTESSRTKNDRKNNAPITYRPAFDRRRTTMRIEEIEADLKTKQIHARPELKDYRQPIYKPDPTTESTSSPLEITTKRGQLRRKRPTYTTSTEGSISRRPYEVKNRFRGRKPTDKPTDKPEAEIDESTTTARNIAIQKYSHRPKLSQRFSKKPEPEGSLEDQDPNDSIHRPKYASPDPERWSPKLSGGSFKPFNPNDITDIPKEETSDNPKDDELEIITVGQEDILISVTPTTNNRVNKKVPDIPPTLEAFVEQTKVTKSEPNDTMSTFESMLEEVMKSLEEQDEDEYTNKVMKHKGGEIGEIPPERIISSGVNYSLKSTTPLQEEITTMRSESSSPNEEEQKRQKQRRGYWKKVKVHPVVEGIEAAESQYYSKTVNRLGQNVPINAIDKTVDDKPKFTVTTYKPKYSFIKNLFENEDEQLDVIPDVDIPKINSKNESDTFKQESFIDPLKFTTESYLSKETPTEKVNPGEMDLGTGSPDPTYDDSSYYTEPTEPTSTSTKHDRSDRFSFMDYLFGVTSSDESAERAINEKEAQNISAESSDYFKNIETDAQANKTTTESTYIPEEFTAETQSQSAEVSTEPVTSIRNKSEDKVETTSVSSFMDPKSVISTSMSTEISHETEICFRGKCIKTVKDLV